MSVASRGSQRSNSHKYSSPGGPHGAPGAPAQGLPGHAHWAAPPGYALPGPPGPGPAQGPPSQRGLEAPSRLAGFAAGLGDLLSWAKTGLVDAEFVKQEAERKKVEIDRALEHTLNEVDLAWQHQRVLLQQQADVARRHAEEQVREAEQVQRALLTSNVAATEKEITDRVSREKGQLGAEAYAAINSLTEREKARIGDDASRNSDEAFRKAQLYLREQVFASNQQIHSEATAKMAEVESEARSALSLVYLPPNLADDKVPASVEAAFAHAAVPTRPPGAAAPLHPDAASAPLQTPPVYPAAWQASVAPAAYDAPSVRSEDTGRRSGAPRASRPH